jgi:hypothetical protein
MVIVYAVSLQKKIICILTSEERATSIANALKMEEVLIEKIIVDNLSILKSFFNK